MMDRTDHDGTIGIAFEKRDQHLIADSGQEKYAVIRTGVFSHEAHPTRGILVARLIQIPMEKHLDPSEIVHIQVLSGIALSFETIRTDDDSGLKSGDGGTLRDARRTKGSVGRHAG